MTTAREDRLFQALTVARGLTPAQLLVHFPAEDRAGVESTTPSGLERPVGVRAGNWASQDDIAAQEAVSDIGSYWFGQRAAVRDHNGERGAA